MFALFNILIYGIFASIMYMLARQSFVIFKEKNKIDIYEWFYIIFYTSIVAISWNTGVDGKNYLVNFINGSTLEEESSEYIYIWLVKSIYLNNVPYTIGMGILGFAQIFPIVKSIKKDRYILMMIPIVLFGNQYFLNYMNAMRQMIVASIFFYACQYIRNKKLISYIIIILLCSLIHKSALILLPFYLICYNENKLNSILKKRWIILIVFIFCIIIGINPSFQRIGNYVQAVVLLTGYESYTDRMDTFINGGYTNETLSYGPMMLSYMLLTVFLILFSNKVILKYKNKIPTITIWYFLAILYSCIYFLVCNISHVLIRPTMYFLPCHLIAVSLLLWYLLKKYKKKYLYILLLTIIWTDCFWNQIKNSKIDSPANYHISFFYDLSEYYRYKRL